MTDKTTDPLDTMPPLAPPDATKEQIAVAAYEAVGAMLYALASRADQTRAKNYVAMQFTGCVLPFDRAEIHLIRPGGMSPTERAEGLSEHVDRLTEQVADLAKANTQIGLQLLDGAKVDSAETYAQFVDAMRATADALRAEVAKNATRLAKLEELAKLAKAWRATQPVSVGSTGPWVRALRDLEEAIDRLGDA